MFILFTRTLVVVVITFAVASERRRYCVARRLSLSRYVCVSAALVSAAKVMRCILCSLVMMFCFIHVQSLWTVISHGYKSAVHRMHSTGYYTDVYHYVVIYLS